MTDRVQCRKCGADLVRDQKVCPQCGELTAAGGKYDIEQEPPPWRPSPRMIKAAAAILAAVLVLAIIIKATRKETPDTVADKWFRALASRNVLSAQQYVTPKLLETLGTRMMSLTTISEEYVTEMSINRSEPKLGKAVYRGADQAEVLLTFTRPDGSPGPQFRLVLVKMDGEWKIDRVL